jgi:hypothetical protein
MPAKHAADLERGRLVRGLRSLGSRGQAVRAPKTTEVDEFYLEHFHLLHGREKTQKVAKTLAFLNPVTAIVLIKQL